MIVIPINLLPPIAAILAILGIALLRKPRRIPETPGSICPVCGSHEINIDQGTMKCEDCHAEAQIRVTFKGAQLSPTEKRMMNDYP